MEFEIVWGSRLLEDFSVLSCDRDRSHSFMAMMGKDIYALNCDEYGVGRLRALLSQQSCRRHQTVIEQCLYDLSSRNGLVLARQQF